MSGVRQGIHDKKGKFNVAEKARFQGAPVQGHGTATLVFTALGCVALLVVVILVAAWYFQDDYRVVAVQKNRPDVMPPPRAIATMPLDGSDAPTDSLFAAPKYKKYQKSSSRSQSSGSGSGNNSKDQLSGECEVAATTDLAEALKGCMNSNRGKAVP